MSSPTLHVNTISRLLPSSSVAVAGGGVTSNGGHAHAALGTISASAVPSSTTTVVTASAGSPTSTSSCSASIVSNASAASSSFHPAPAQHQLKGHGHSHGHGHGHGHRHTPSISSFNAAACRPLPPPLIQQASPASLKHSQHHYNHNSNNNTNMIPLATFPPAMPPAQPAAATAAPSNTNANTTTKFAPSEHPLVLGTGPRWLHFDPDLAPTHIRVSPPIKNAQVKDDDPNWQWLMLDPSSASSPTTIPFPTSTSSSATATATVSIAPVPPPSGTQVLLALANPRWYLGAKPSGELFLLNTPTTMTVWTVKLLPNHRDFLLVSSAHATLLSASDTSLAMLPSTLLADLPAAADIPSQLASTLTAAAVFHAHLIPPHVFDPTRQPTAPAPPEVQKPQPALTRGNSNSSSLYRGRGRGGGGGKPSPPRPGSPSDRRRRGPPPPPGQQQQQGPPTTITAPVALLTTDKRAICKCPTLSSNRSGRKQIVGITAAPTKPSSPSSTSAAVDPMEYYVGKTTRKEVGNPKKNKAELVAFFYVHVAELRYPPKPKPGAAGAGAGAAVTDLAPAATESSVNLTGSTAAGVLSPILADAVLKPTGVAPQLPPIHGITGHAHARKNSLSIQHPAHIQPPAPPAGAAQRTPIGYRPGAPLDTAKCAGRKYLLVAADTRNYLSLDVHGRLLELAPTTTSDAVLWTYHPLPSSPLSLALCHVASGMYLTIPSPTGSKIRGARLSASASSGPALLTQAQALKLYVPPALPQAVNALHARPPPNRMLVFSVALCATSLVSASAAIANALLNYSRTMHAQPGPAPAAGTKAGQLVDGVDAGHGDVLGDVDGGHGHALADLNGHVGYAWPGAEDHRRVDAFHDIGTDTQFASASDWHAAHGIEDHFDVHAHMDHVHDVGGEASWWDGGAHDWAGGGGAVDDGGVAMIMGGMFG